MEKQVTEALGSINKVLGSTMGRDKVLKLVQYIFFYLKNSTPDKNVTNPEFGNVHYNAWIARKFMRFGLLWVYIKQIKEFTDPTKDKDESQVGLYLSGSTILNKLDAEELKELDEGPASKPKNENIGFDIPGLKLLSTLSNLGFCLSDIPLFLKELKVLDLTPQGMTAVSRVKHMFWLLSCAFTLYKEYLLIKAINERVQRLKSFMFTDKNISEEDRKKFDGKCDVSFITFIFCNKLTCLNLKI